MSARRGRIEEKTDRYLFWVPDFQASHFLPFEGLPIMTIYGSDVGSGGEFHTLCKHKKKKIGRARA